MRLFFCSLFLFFTCQSALAFDVPPLRGAVNDYAGVIPLKMERTLESSLADFRKKGGAHIAVLTIDSLQGEPIEQAAIQVVDRWQIGDRQLDNGVLLILASQERQVRIEVGQGLEGQLTDAYSRRIIDDIMVPLFRQGEVAQGIFLGVIQIAKLTNPEISMESGGVVSSNWKKKPHSGYKLGDFVVLIFFILFFIFGGRSSFLAFLLGSHVGGRSSGGRMVGGGFGRGGGGGFSGGGGGFSGGGASGSW